MGRAVFADARQHLAVFAGSAWTVKNQIAQAGQAGRKRSGIQGF